MAVLRAPVAQSQQWGALSMCGVSSGLAVPTQTACARRRSNRSRRRSATTRATCAPRAGPIRTAAAQSSSPWATGSEASPSLEEPSCCTVATVARGAIERALCRDHP
eukprot:6076284-Prymnesium_polylepis.1